MSATHSTKSNVAIVVEDDHDSSSDDDYKSSDAAQNSDDDVSSSDDASPSVSVSPRKRKRAGTKPKKDDVQSELDSGDEDTIKERKRRRRRGEVESDDEGGDGGFVRTRAQRRHDQEERRPLARTEGATIDVDSVWARLAALPISRPEPTLPDMTSQDQIDDKYMTIKRSTKFAGETTTEEKRVLKSSKEAQLYLAELEMKKREKPIEPENNEAAKAQDETTVPISNIRRPLRRPSKFEPNPLGEVRNLAPHLQLRWPRNKSTTLIVQDATANASMLPPPRPGQEVVRLNTVQKSRQDWAGFVDKSGIAEELDEHGRSKSSYLARTEFLGRMEQKREGERLTAKAKVA